MNRIELRWFTIILIFASLMFYIVQVLVFNKGHDTAFYFMQDMAFLPLSTLFVTFVVDRLLAQRERLSRAHKMNMVIGTFFAGVGDKMLRRASQFITNYSDITQDLAITPTWSVQQILNAASQTVKIDLKIHVEATSEPLMNLKAEMDSERDFLLRLLENPILMEHEQFTDMLWAIFHVQDELAARKSLENLHHDDTAHLAGDLDRAYTRLLGQWLNYMAYLRQDYPFLFSLAARTNPLRADAHAEIGY